MASRLPLLPITKCPACSLRLLNSLTSRSRIIRTAAQGRPTILQRARIGATTRRSFASDVGNGDGGVQGLQTEGGVVGRDLNSTGWAVAVGAGTVWRDLNYINSSNKIVEEEEETTESESATNEPVPWYLKDSYTTKGPLIPERPPPPPLPDDPPELLGEIVDKLDIELGITDINIMDLRSLNPSPALGHDIIMVFGNARSERHLHSIADTICRWLRQNHEMQPFADGLIGRNARKLIDRRRIRRGHVSASQIGEKDELVATEWVCVNTGYEGIILQLFTPRRREELRLEELWERKLDTNRKNIQKMAKAIEEGKKMRMQELYDGEDGFEEVVVLEEESEAEFKAPDKEEDVAIAQVDEDYIGTDPEPLRTVFPIGPVSSFPKQQTRAFHTSCTIHSSAPSQNSTTPSRFKPSKLPSTYQEFMEQVPLISAHIQNGAYADIEKSLATYYPKRTFPQAMKQAGILYAYIYHLQNIPPETATESLGNSAFDTTSTPFLRSFFQEIPTIPEYIHYHAWLSLLIQAHSIKPSAYPETCFWEFIIQMKASGMSVPLPFYMAILKVLATTPQLRKRNPGQEKTSTFLQIKETTIRMNSMMKIVSDMSRSSFYDVNTPDIYTLLTQGLMSKDIEGIHRLAMDVCRVPSAAAQTRGLLSLSRKEHAPDRRIFLLERLMEDYSIQQINPLWYINFLTATAIAGYWPAFWNRWNDVHFLANAGRGAELYKLVLGLVSMGGNGNEAVNALRNLTYWMGRESPKIELDRELARGFLAVMDVAGGGGVGEGRKVMGSEYWALMKQCERLVAGSGAKGREGFPFR